VPRAIVLLLDSFGIGAAEDADKYGDEGANTFGNIALRCAAGSGDQENLRQGPLQIPNLLSWGLAAAAEMSAGEPVIGVPVLEQFVAKYGYAVEQSYGKDTPSGHWEIAGVPCLFDWGYFPPDYPSFPESLINDFLQQCHLPGILGNKHASGTEIIEELGEEHIRSGKPIVYTSADSVFQIAAHEKYFGLQRLYELCEVARKLVDPYNIGRVIARPFVGEVGHFERTGNRRDYSMPPPAPTLFDQLVDQQGTVIAIGKTADIFAHRGVSQTIKANGIDGLFDATLSAVSDAPDKSLIFTNFVDFDSHYGHRRDVPGYAAALELLDSRLPELVSQLKLDDCVIVAADHGCDPTWPGSDHTREHIPVLCYGSQIEAGSVGRRGTFADIGQSIATWLGIAPLGNGTTFLR